MKKTIITTLVLILSLQAWDHFWYNEPEPPAIEDAEPMPGTLTKGDRKALILVSRFPEDTVQYMPHLFYDSLIAPSIDSLGDSLYMWSITDFLYTASWHQLRMTGDVNPGLDSQYIVAPHSLEYYRQQWPTAVVSQGGRIDNYEKDILEAIDPYVDFNDYDEDNDGCVDFVFFIHPYCPNSGFWNKTNNYPDSSNSGYSRAYGGEWRQLATDDERDGYPGEYMKIAKRVRLGSAMAYYHPDPDDQLDRGAASNLCCHELGHSFSDGVAGPCLKTSQGDFDTELADRYDQNGGNWYAGSVGVGKYTVMQMDYFTMHPQLYTPWERMVLGWIKPTVIDTNSQHMILEDFNDILSDSLHRAYLVPVDSVLVDTAGYDMWLREYFIITNYQPSSQWLDDLGRTWIPELDSGAAPNAHGLLIWHVNERFWDDDFQNNEFAKFEDMECAEGLMDTVGTGSSPWGTEAGWDGHDRWCKLPWIEGTIGWAEDHNATSSSPLDFFNPDYKNAFHTLTNPTSDGYNMRGYPSIKYRYPGTPAVEEALVLQNLPTHMSIEGIHYENGTDIELCIRRSRIWTDQELAMDRTTQRKFLCDSTDTFHFIYPLRGHIYYTRSYNPSQIWYKAEMVGPDPVFYDSTGYGIWPALTLDENRQPLAIFYDTSCSKVVYNYTQIVNNSIGGKDTVWVASPDTLDLTGVPGPVAIDFALSYNGKGGYEIPDGLPGHSQGGGGTMPALPDSSLSPMVHLAYITRDGSQDKLYYTYFPKDAAEEADDNEECVDNLLVEGTSHVITGAAIELDPANGKVCIAYGVVKNDTAACYYREKTIYGWQSIRRLPTSISSSAREPLVPFLDIVGDSIRVVFNANDSVYVNVKSLNIETPSGGWNAVSTRVSQASGENRYAQIGSNLITWTNIAGADTNVYGCHLASDYTPGTPFRVSSPYPEKDWFCQVTRVDTSAACLYQHGTFYGPKWAVYYRGPDGFGGNMENEGPPVAFVPAVPVFKMAVSRNILRGAELSVFTTDECELAAYDVTGRQVARFKVESNGKGGTIETPVDCTNWSSGVYFVRAIHQGDNKTDIRTEKVVLFR